MTMVSNINQSANKLISEPYCLDEDFRNVNIPQFEGSDPLRSTTRPILRTDHEQLRYVALDWE